MKIKCQLCNEPAESHFFNFRNTDSLYDQIYFPNNILCSVCRLHAFDQLDIEDDMEKYGIDFHGLILTKLLHVLMMGTARKEDRRHQMYYERGIRFHEYQEE